jgi:hypothetical protein
MKPIRVILVAVALVMFAAGYSSAALVNIGSDTITVGETTTIDVVLSGIGTEAPTAYDFAISYNTSGLAASDFMAGSATPASGLFSGEINGGLISAFYFAFSATPPIVTNGVLASFDVTGLMAGVYPLDFSDINIFSESGPVSFDTAGGTITVNAVPIPSAILLLGSGLLGLIGVRRMRHA